MTPLNQHAPDRTRVGRQRARTRRSFDAVLASYIRELATAPSRPGDDLGAGEVRAAGRERVGAR
jgi:hypothetical protein